MNPREELRELQTKLNTLVTGAKSAGRALTDGEIAEVNAASTRATELKAAIDRAERSTNALASFNASASLDTDDIAFGEGQKTGYVTSRSVDRLVKTSADKGIKALVASGSSATPVALETAPYQMGQAPIGILGVLPVRVRDTPSYSYLRQTVRDNKAAVVAAGAQKPTSEFTVTEVDGKLSVIAHLSEYVDKYLLEDNIDLERFIRSEMVGGVLNAATAKTVADIIATSGIQTTAFNSNAADSLYAGIAAVEGLGFTADLLVLNRASYTALRLSKDANGQYFGGGPFDGSQDTALWGRQTLVSDAVPADKAIVLDKSKVSLSIDRAGMALDWDTASGFGKNEVRARAEARYGTDVYVPAAVSLVSLAA